MSQQPGGANPGRVALDRAAPDRIALVSGGSRGIGAAVVRKLAADGWDIGFSCTGDGPAARAVEKDAWALGVRVTGRSP